MAIQINPNYAQAYNNKVNLKKNKYKNKIINYA